MVRKFDADGRLLQPAGKSGEGPFEFRVISGLIEGPEGQVLLTDGRLGCITLLGPNLEPDRVFQPRPAPRGKIMRMGRTLAIVTSSALRSLAVSQVTEEGDGIWSVTPPPLDRVMQVPYWGSAFQLSVAASPELLAVAVSLLYPVYFYDTRGRLVDSIARPPRSFRRTPSISSMHPLDDSSVVVGLERIGPSEWKTVLVGILDLRSGSILGFPVSDVPRAASGFPNRIRRKPVCVNRGGPVPLLLVMNDWAFEGLALEVPTREVIFHFLTLAPIRLHNTGRGEPVPFLLAGVACGSSAVLRCAQSGTRRPVGRVAVCVSPDSARVRG